MKKLVQNVQFIADPNNTYPEAISEEIIVTTACKELTDMDEEAETKAIEKWLRMVDKPLATKERDKKDAEPRDK